MSKPGVSPQGFNGRGKAEGFNGRGIALGKAGKDLLLSDVKIKSGG